MENCAINIQTIKRKNKLSQKFSKVSGKYILSNFQPHSNFQPDFWPSYTSNLVNKLCDLTFLKF